MQEKYTYRYVQANRYKNYDLFDFQWPPKEPLLPLKVDNLGGIRKVLRGESDSSKWRAIARGAHGKTGGKSDLYKLLVAPLGQGDPYV